MYIYLHMGRRPLVTREEVLNAARDALLGSPDWSLVWSVVPTLIPLAVITISIGVFAFRLALKRERRRGTLGLY